MQKKDTKLAVPKDNLEVLYHLKPGRSCAYSLFILSAWTKCQVWSRGKNNAFILNHKMDVCICNMYMCL